MLPDALSKGIKAQRYFLLPSTIYTATHISTESCKKIIFTIADVFPDKFCLGEILTASLSSPSKEKGTSKDVKQVAVHGLLDKVPRVLS